MSLSVFLSVAAAGLVTGVVVPRRPRLWLTVTVIAAFANLLAASAVLGGDADWSWRSEFAVGGEPLHLRLDGVSALFLALLSLIGGTGAVYARGYWNDERYATSAPRGRMWWSGMILSMGFVLLSANGLHFLIGWELFAVCSYFLITLDGRRREVRAAGWLYLAASHAGTLCLFAFFALLAARTGSWELGPMREQAGLAPLVWLALGGFAVKAGFFPVHIWLPSAHANAPSHVSALMSGVAIKMGIYGLVRFSGWLPAPQGFGWVVIGIGAVTAVIGISFALAQNDLKRLLAYSSVENVGIMAIGLGGALLGLSHDDAPWGRLMFAGALLHFWNHGVFKALLFFGAGSLLHATGTREMSRLGGLWRSMPWTAGVFALGGAAVSALPPLNGFVSEWLVYLGLFDAAAEHSTAGVATMPAALMMAVTGAIALATFVKAAAVIFLGAPRTKAAAQAHEAGWLMRGPMVLLAAICLAVGLAPALVWPAISRVAAVWRPEWAAVEAPTALHTLTAAHLVLATAIPFGVFTLWRLTRTRGLRRGLTWDCGYARPTPRMQYTSGAFAEIVAGWLTWIFAPERVERRPRATFPARAIRVERVPETVLERVLHPGAKLVLRAAAGARRLQHGRLQLYIVYVAGAVAALAIIAWLGGRP